MAARSLHERHDSGTQKKMFVKQLKGVDIMKHRCIFRTNTRVCHPWIVETGTFPIMTFLKRFIAAICFTFSGCDIIIKSTLSKREAKHLLSHRTSWSVKKNQFWSFVTYSAREWDGEWQEFYRLGRWQGSSQRVNGCKKTLLLFLEESKLDWKRLTVQV